MAIDTSLFGASIPAGTYAAGDKITLSPIAGPSVVRSGRGAAILKRITVGSLLSVSGSSTYWKITVKNSDWIDGATSLTANLFSATSLDERSGCVQPGHDCSLTPNSSWEVTAECVAGGTTTVGNSIFALIDVDYPSVSSITNPDALQGFPTTIEHNVTTNVAAAPDITAATWMVFNEDIFKAGYEYALQKLEIVSTVRIVGFIALSNAAGMGGLQRIIPISNVFDAIRNKVAFATKLVKGPMDIKYMLFDNVSGTASAPTTDLILDFVKRKVA